MIRAFSGAVPRPTRVAELLAPDERGVWADAGEVGLQAHAPEPALVAQREHPAVGEADREAVPLRAVGAAHPVAGGRVVDDDPPGHAEVDAEVRALAVVGLDPHRLAVDAAPS